MKRLLPFLLVLCASTAQAAYTTPTIKLVESQPNKLHAMIVFTGDAGEEAKAVDFYATSVADLQRQVYAFMASLNTVNTDAKTLAPGNVLPPLTPPTPPDPVPPTADQKFFSDLSRFYGVQKAVDAGIVPDTDPEYTKLRDSLKAAFLSAYVGLGGWPR